MDPNAKAAAFTPSVQKLEVPVTVAEQVDLRIGTIVEITPVPDADRLMKLTVDFGSERRTVIAGIRKERSDPTVLVGRQALFYYNLPKKKIRGQLSEAMLCDVGYADGITPALLQPEWPVPNGTRAG
jgi:tRNA-binding protein